MTDWQKVRDQAAALGSDGCSGPTVEWYRDCCLQHDIIYRTGRDEEGQPVSRREADARFRRCMQQQSRLGRYSPVSWWRWLAVRALGWQFYEGDRHG